MPCVSLGHQKEQGGEDSKRYMETIGSTETENIGNEAAVVVYLRARVFREPKSILVAKSVKSSESKTEKRDPKKHLSLSVAICNQK